MKKTVKGHPEKRSDGKIKKTEGQQYDRYEFSFREWIIYSALWLALDGGLSYIFFRSIPAFAILLPAFPLYIKFIRTRLKKKRKWKLLLQFTDALQGISTALQAGNSAENAFRKTYVEMVRLHGESSDIAKELHTIVRGVENNRPIEGMLGDFANRSGIEEIEDFADIFSVGKRSGGNLRQMISSCCNTISDRVEMQREFRVMLSSKKFELQIMSVVPVGILFYIGSVQKGFFDVLYQSFQGRMIMIVCFLLYLSAGFWGMKIIEKTGE